MALINVQFVKSPGLSILFLLPHIVTVIKLVQKKFSTSSGRKPLTVRRYREQNNVMAKLDRFASNVRARRL
jgi:hypothetical protein